MTNNYNKISLYLANEKIFKDDYIYFEHRNSIIFGKNGTGKSTICKLIKQQIKDNDCEFSFQVQGLGATH